MQKQHNVSNWWVLRALGERLGIAWRLFRDPRVPAWAKTVPLAALIYVLWPMDVVTDVLPGLGQLDDITLLLLATEAFIRLCPRELWSETRSPKTGAPGDTIEGEYRVMDETRTLDDNDSPRWMRDHELGNTPHHPVREDHRP